ncbi:MAG: hypothetical protein JW888_00340 [Pirellulales bacterium]|nr:hypothetical protein [Pirellulales bacterium]
MSIRVECHSCGRKFQAPKRLAGQQVKCPGCSATIYVSTPAVAAIEDGPSILVECGCHKQFPVRRELAGKQEPCPACGQMITIPPLKPAGAAEPPVKTDLDRLLEAEMNDPASPHDPRTPRKKCDEGK